MNAFAHRTPMPRDPWRAPAPGAHVQRARAGRDNLVAALRRYPWFAGAGILGPAGGPFALQVSAVRITDQVRGAVPRAVDGMPVYLQETGPIVALASGPRETGDPWDAMPMEELPAWVLSAPPLPGGDTPPPPAEVSPGRGWSKTARGTWVYTPPNTASLSSALFTSSFGDTSGPARRRRDTNPWHALPPRRR
jgi:hypothetical protein